MKWCKNCEEEIEPGIDHSHLGWCVDCFRAIAWTTVISAVVTMILNLIVYQLI